MFEENLELHIKGINIDWDKISRGMLHNRCNDYVGTAASMVAAMIEK